MLRGDVLRLRGVRLSASLASLWGEQVIIYVRPAGLANRARIPGVSRRASAERRGFRRHDATTAVRVGRPMPGADDPHHTARPRRRSPTRPRCVRRHSASAHGDALTTRAGIRLDALSTSAQKTRGSQRTKTPASVFFPRRRTDTPPGSDPSTVAESSLTRIPSIATPPCAIARRASERLATNPVSTSA